MAGYIEPSPVHLGLQDGLIPETYTTNAFISKIGGTPDWLCSPPSHPMCPLCKKPQLLIVQLYCPLPESAYHRTLYVFACSNCYKQPQSWTVLRCQKLDPTFGVTEEKVQAPVEVQKESIFGSVDWGVSDDEDEWGREESPKDSKSNNPSMASISSDLVKDATKQFESMAIDTGSESSNNEAIQAIGSQPLNKEDTIEAKFIAVIEHYEEEETKSSHAERLAKEYFQKEGMDEDMEGALFDKSDKQGGGKRGKSGRAGDKRKAGGSKGASGDAQYKKAKPFHGNESFEKFLKKISKCRKQILRYSHGGEALHTLPSTLQVPHCESCGHARIYECQLMPALVPLLNRVNTQKYNASAPVVEFATVIVYSCSRSCGEEGVRTEHIQLEMENEEEEIIQHAKKIKDLTGFSV